MTGLYISIAVCVYLAIGAGYARSVLIPLWLEWDKMTGAKSDKALIVALSIGFTIAWLPVVVIVKASEIINGESE